jgi:hypothetical protein
MDQLSTLEHAHVSLESSRHQFQMPNAQPVSSAQPMFQVTIANAAMGQPGTGGA